MSLLSSLRIGRTAMRAASVAVEVTGNNVANASTDGYSRQSVDLRTRDPLQRRGLFVGQGVTAQGLQRASDRLLRHQLMVNTGAHAQQDSAHTVLSTLEVAFGDLESGISSELSAFFDSLEAASVDPSDTALRREVLSSASSFADAISRVGGAAADVATDAEEQMSGVVDQANQLLTELASVNERIGQSGGASPDLADQRDLLIRDLATLTGATADVDGQGRATLFIGDHAAVGGSRARTLSVGTNADGEVALKLSAGEGQLTVDRSVGGQLRGLADGAAAAREAVDNLDAFAVAFADAMNAQHASGIDSAGATGGVLFTYDPNDPAVSLSLDAAMEDNPAGLAFGATTNAGDATNLDALLALRNVPLLGDETPEDALADLQSGIGSAVSRAEAEASALDATRGDIEALHDAIVGVDLDEEASKLIEYQASYEAAIRVVEATNQMLEELMGAVR